MAASRRLLELVRWTSGRAWSRAGAVASVLWSGVPRRVLAVTTRLALLLTGSMVIATSVALMLWNNLGPGPLDVFIGAVRVRTGMPLTVAVWATVAMLIVVAWALGRRPGFGTILSPLVVGPTMQLVLAGLQAFDNPDSLPVRILLHVVGVFGVGLGAGALIVSGLGAGSGELLAAAASDRSGRPETRMRTGFELTWFVAGAALGGPFGIGTLIVALLIGPAVAYGYRSVDAAVSASLRRLAVVATPV